MSKIKTQLSKLYLFTIFGNLSLAGAWVALLSARGYDLVQIGIAETMFHVTSILFEIPSGALADVFGRKKMLLVSAFMRMLGNIIMIVSWNFPMVCMSLVFQALSYNFASGSDDALAYDSLKKAGEEAAYEKYNSNQMILYRICDGISTLCAGLALVLGYRIAYGTGVIAGIFQIITALSLKEVCGSNHKDLSYGKAAKRYVMEEIVRCFQKSVCFLYHERRVTAYMLCNSLVGAVDVLLLFFLQAKLPECGMPQWGLGAALLFMQMGGVVGARLVLRLDKWSYPKVAAVMSVPVAAGFLAEHSGIYLIMMIGGFLSAIGDDVLQIRTNAKLQGMVPSEQRATIMSGDSFLFSVIMIVLSPLAGIVFSVW